MTRWADDPTPALPTGVRALVVDDNEDAASMLAALLSRRGWEVKTVLSGAEVEQAVASRAPSVVLLDLGMPDVSGYEVARRLREAGHTETVLIALTGYSDEEARRRTAEAGFDGHLVKPLEFDALRALLGRLSDRLEMGEAGR